MHLVICPSVSSFCAQSVSFEPVEENLLKLFGRNVNHNEMMCRAQV
jgi:hypothetical protein